MNGENIGCWLAVGIIGGLFLFFEVRRFVLWIVGFYELKKENKGLLKKIKSDFEKIENIFLQAKENLEKLKKSQPKSNWENYEKVFFIIKLEDERSLINTAERECSKNIFWARIARKTIDAANQELKWDQQILNNLESLKS